MEAKLLRVINECNEYLDREAIDEVMHFYNHGEFEMALEGLLIEMINAKEYPKKCQISDVISLCYYYKIDKESVFDSEIWNKFLNWKKEYLEHSQANRHTF